MSETFKSVSGEIWECTMVLRWFRPYTLSAFIDPVPELQQLWISHTGKQEWRKVELVVEEQKAMNAPAKVHAAVEKK